MLSDKVQRIGLSATMRISGTAMRMKAEGIDVIDLSVGEPDFPTPENAKEAAKKAIDSNITKYTPNDGFPQFKEVIIRRFYEDHGLVYEPDEIIISSGAKNCLYNSCATILNEGEEVIIPAPYWVSYPHIVQLMKAVPIIVQTSEEDGFRLTANKLKAAITCNTKALLLNSPSNPTGACYSREQLAALAEVAVAEGLVTISDEIYEKLVYDGFKNTCFASLGKEVKAKTVIINGVSKAYSMTGWRIGYAAGPKEVIAGMNKVQSHNTSNASSVSQMASLEALSGPQTAVTTMVAEFQKRRNYMFHRLQQIPKVSCTQAQGAFYLFPNFSAYYDMEFEGKRIRNSHGLAYYLLKHARVAVVPGDVFGADNFIRFSYSTSMELIEKAMDRVTEAISKLQPAKKVSRKPLNNTITRVKDYVPTEPNISLEKRDALVVESEDFLTYEGYYEWNVNIAGVILQLRANSPHLNDFWIENWYPAQLETDLEPHGIIYAINWIPGREAHAFYNSESRTAFFFKSAFYAQLRSLALGMVTDITERLYELHTVHASSIDFAGRGLLLMAPPGCGKSTHLAELLKQNGARFHSNDIVFIRYAGGEALADTVERKFYIFTDFVEKLPVLTGLFDRSKCENVITSKDNCINEECQRLDDCRLERGSPYCFSASDKSRAMLDPYWLGGPNKHVKRTSVRWLFILRRDLISPPIIKLDPEGAIRILEEGRSQASSGAMVNQPFFNPHALVRTMERIELQKRYFQRLLNIVPCYIINTGSESVREIQQRIRAIINGDEEQGVK